MILNQYVNQAKFELSKHKSDCLKAAKFWRSQRFFTWANQWEKYAQNSGGEYPKCLHKDIQEDMFTYKVAGVWLFNNQAYDEWLEKSVTKNPEHSGTNMGGGRGNRCDQGSPCGCNGNIKRDELTMSQLGEIRDENGHPYKLIALAKKLKKKYHRVYAKPTCGCKQCGGFRTE